MTLFFKLTCTFFLGHPVNSHFPRRTYVAFGTSRAALPTCTQNDLVVSLELLEMMHLLVTSLVNNLRIIINVLLIAG
jgi:hypothetical protein